MNKLTLAVLTVATMGVGIARADEPKGAPPAGGAPMGPPSPPKPGAEDKALSWMAGSMKMSGMTKENAYGPGVPAMPTTGKHTCKWMTGGLWLECDIEETVGKGKMSMTWKGHMMTGWDYGAKTYRSVGTDNMGAAFMMVGKMEGQKLVLDSASDMTTPDGKPMKMRMTFDATDPKNIKVTDEQAVGGGAMKVISESTMKK